jgi:hypothetical protein
VITSESSLISLIDSGLTTRPSASVAACTFARIDFSISGTDSPMMFAIPRLDFSIRCAISFCDSFERVASHFWDHRQRVAFEMLAAFMISRSSWNRKYMVFASWYFVDLSDDFIDQCD